MGSNGDATSPESPSFLSFIIAEEVDGGGEDARASSSSSLSFLRASSVIVSFPASSPPINFVNTNANAANPVPNASGGINFAFATVVSEATALLKSQTMSSSSNGELSSPPFSVSSSFSKSFSNLLLLKSFLSSSSFPSLCIRTLSVSSSNRLKISAAFSLCSGLAFGISLTARSKISRSSVTVVGAEEEEEEEEMESFFSSSSSSSFLILTSGAVRLSSSMTMASSITLVRTSSSRKAPFNSFFTISTWSRFGNCSNASIKCSAVASCTDAAFAASSKNPKKDAFFMIAGTSNEGGGGGGVAEFTTTALRRRRRPPRKPLVVSRIFSFFSPLFLLLFR